MAYLIFVCTLLCIYCRPFGLPIWLFSTLGAVCAYVFGVVSLADITLVWEITKPSTLALIGLILLTLAFEKLGFFTHLAQYIAPQHSAISTWKIFVFLILLGSVISIIFANDGAILVLTPLVYWLFNTQDSKLESQNNPNSKLLLAPSNVQDSMTMQDSHNKQDSQKILESHSLDSKNQDSNTHDSKAIQHAESLYNCKGNHIDISQDKPITPNATNKTILHKIILYKSTLQGSSSLLESHLPKSHLLESHLLETHKQDSQNKTTKTLQNSQENQAYKDRQDSHNKQDSISQNSHRHIFTPLMIFLLMMSFVSDFASNALVISNLTNIITAEMFRLEFVAFASIMALPQVFALLIFIGIAWLLFRHYLPKNLSFHTHTDTPHYPNPYNSFDNSYPDNSPYNTQYYSPHYPNSFAMPLNNTFNNPSMPSKYVHPQSINFTYPYSIQPHSIYPHSKLKKIAPKPTKYTLALCYTLIITLLVGIIIGQRFDVPLYVFLYLTSTVALCYGAFLGYIKTRNLLQETPFSIIIFSLGLFVVVFSIKNAGGLEFLHIMLESLAKHSILTQIFSIGFLSAFGSSVINNLPMVLLGNLALESFSLESLSQVSSTTDSIHKQALVFAHLLGCNIGSKITPIGSLATLLWLSKLSIYGVKIPILYYMGFACILSLCVLCAALFGLWVSLVFLI